MKTNSYLTVHKCSGLLSLQPSCFGAAGLLVLSDAGEMVEEKSEGRILLLAAGLVHNHAQLMKLAFNLRQGQKVRSGGQDGRFKHGMFGPVKAEEIPQPAAMNDLRVHAAALLVVVDGAHTKFIVTAGLGQNESAHGGRWLQH